VLWVYVLQIGAKCFQALWLHLYIMKTYLSDFLLWVQSESLDYLFHVGVGHRETSKSNLTQGGISLQTFLKIIETAPWDPIYLDIQLLDALVLP
jgi:hypothetical protein